MLHCPLTVEQFGPASPRRFKIVVEIVEMWEESQEVG